MVISAQEDFEVIYNFHSEVESFISFSLAAPHFKTQGRVFSTLRIMMHDKYKLGKKIQEIKVP